MNTNKPPTITTHVTLKHKTHRRTWRARSLSQVTEASRLWLHPASSRPQRLNSWAPFEPLQGSKNSDPNKDNPKKQTKTRRLSLHYLCGILIYSYLPHKSLQKHFEWLGMDEKRRKGLFWLLWLSSNLQT